MGIGIKHLLSKILSKVHPFFGVGFGSSALALLIGFPFENAIINWLTAWVLIDTICICLAIENRKNAEKIVKTTIMALTESDY